jgi:hypothetical protein
VRALAFIYYQHGLQAIELALHTGTRHLESAPERVDGACISELSFMLTLYEKIDFVAQ